MTPLSDLVNAVFGKRLLLLLLVVAAVQWSLGPVRSLPWPAAVEAVIVIALLLHKHSVAGPWLKEGSRISVFLKAFFVYALPGVVAWALFATELVRRYLLEAGYAPSGAWATLSITVGALLLARALAGKELAQLGRSRN